MIYNPWAYSLIVLALVAMALTRGVPRAWLWLGVGGTSFVISSLYWDFANEKWRLLHPIITLFCDTAVCLTVHRFAHEKWEFGIMLAYVTSVFCSGLMLGRFMPDGTVYASLLELCNLCAIIWIGGVGIVQMAGRNVESPFHDLDRRLHSPRVPND